MKISIFIRLCIATALILQVFADGSYRLSDDWPTTSLREQARRSASSWLPPPSAIRGGRDAGELRTTKFSLPSSAQGENASDDAVVEEQDEGVHHIMPTFRGASWMTLANILLFCLRPDPDVPWPTRVPRVLWEVIVWCNLRRAGGTQHADNLPTTYFAWLAVLTGSTGLVDLFVWAPLYGAFVNFQTCQGGWMEPKRCRMDPLKGYSRLLVAVQSVLGGMVYLHSAIRALHAIQVRRTVYRERRQQQEQQQQAMFLMQQQNSPYRPLPYEAPSQRQPPYHYRR